MQTVKKYSHVFWDWNGTLFDDVEWCVTVMNKMLTARGLRKFGGVEEYRRVFGFPVIDYYRRIGFDLDREPFGELAEEYVALYHSERTGGSGLSRGALPALEALRERRIRQIVLSASEEGALRAQIEGAGIIGYFDEILGISDIYAGGKLGIGLEYIRKNNIGRALLIGDTEHDFEVAGALGIDCLLVASGHQNIERLAARGVPVIEDLTRLVEYIR